MSAMRLYARGLRLPVGPLFSSIDGAKFRARSLHMPNEKPSEPSPARRARLFRNGRNQAVRIPREFELDADEVLIRREDDRLVVVPVQKPPSLAEVLARLRPLDEDFPNTADPPAKPQDLL